MSASASIQPRIVQRPRSQAVEDAALGLGYTHLQASIIAGRLSDAQAGSLQRQLRPQMSELDPPDLLPDIDKAVDRICRAIFREEPVVVCTDHDADGVSGHHVIRAAMIDVFGHPGELTHSFISHRLKEGYGISDGVVDRIGAAGISNGLLLSADQGSSDQPRIERLRQMGIDTVVTDHHGVEGTGPASAVAVVNPVREDSAFPDKFIAGCHVAWLTMAAVRRELIRRKHLHPDTPHLGDLFDVVGMGTTADCVSFARSRNNRLIVQRGLHRINHDPAPCWQALREIRSINGPFTAETYAFTAGPMINARGRVDEAMAGVRFLRSATIEQARRYAILLNDANEERKGIERVMKERAMEAAQGQIANGMHGLAVWLEEGHSGVHGIVASRLTEAFGRPTVCISPKQGHPGLVTASARAIPGFHVRNAFEWIDTSMPGLLVAWGGHEGAGGMTFSEKDIPTLQAMWDQAVINSGVELGPTIITDGPLPALPSLSMLSELAVLEPYGREFDAPRFSQQFTLEEARPIGQDGKHLKLSLSLSGRRFDGIWFNAPELGWRPEKGMPVLAAFTLDANTFRGETNLQLKINHLAPAVRN